MRSVVGETKAAVGQREATSRVDVDRAIDRIENSAAHLRVRDRPVPGDDATDLVTRPCARGRGESEERDEQSAEGDRPNDEEWEGPHIPSGTARPPNISAGWGTRLHPYKSDR